MSEVFDFWVSTGKVFLEPKLIYALLLLIPFLLLYLIRPKPKHEVIPTLMFLFKDLGRDRKTTFLRRLIHDLLFILQFLALLMILLAMAKPYINVTRESLFKNTVVVLDVSASMKSDYDSKTRFDEAVSIAKKNLGTINTLILVKRTPEVVLIEKSGGEIREYLDSLQPTDNPTNLYDAISIAGGYAKGDSRVVVISDFIDTETSSNIETAKKTLESQGIKVDLVRVFKPVNNIGIVDLDIEEKKTTAVIRNYNSQEANVKLKVNSLEETLLIPAGSQELFSFSTPPGTSKLEIEVQGLKDSLEADNAAFISAPGDTKRRVLLITNNAEPAKTFLFNAFDVMKNTEVEVAVPPKIPEIEGYDLFVFKDINPNLVLPGTFKGVKEEVEEDGKAVIIAAQKDMLAVNYYGLAPLTFSEAVSATTNILATSSGSLTANIEFGITKKYFKSSPIEGISFVVIAAAEDKSPIITFNALGKGKAFFYGILDEDKEAETSFAKSPVYFVFWKRLVDLATDTPLLKDLNYKTGSVLNFNEEQRIATPTGKITTDSLALDNAGLYTLNDRVIAINLINDKESDVNSQESISETGLSAASDKFKEKVPFELTDYLIIAVIILLMLEFIYIKLRGDL